MNDMHKFEGTYTIKVKALVNKGSEDDMLQEAFDLFSKEASNEIQLILESNGFIARESELLLGDKGEADEKYISSYKAIIEKAQQDVKKVYNKVNRKIFRHKIE